MQVHDDELEYYRRRCSILERENVELKNIIKKKDEKISMVELGKCMKIFGNMMTAFMTWRLRGLNRLEEIKRYL